MSNTRSKKNSKALCALAVQRHVLPATTKLDAVTLWDELQKERTTIQRKRDERRQPAYRELDEPLCSAKSLDRAIMNQPLRPEGMARPSQVSLPGLAGYLQPTDLEQWAFSAHKFYAARAEIVAIAKKRRRAERIGLIHALVCCESVMERLGMRTDRDELADGEMTPLQRLALS